jgi:acyl-CoA thioesterase FadM
MYVFFRLFKVMILGFFKSKISALEESQTELMVWPNDIDYNLHMNNGRYLTLMDIGRMDLSMRTGLIKVMLTHGWIPVVGSAQIRYLREIRAFKKFSIHSRVASWDQKWFYMAQDFKVGDTVHARAMVKAVFKKKGKTIPPQQIIAEMGLDLKNPPDDGGFIETYNKAEKELQPR